MMLHGDDKYKRPIGVLFHGVNGRRISGQLRLKRGNLFDSNVVRIADDEFVHIAEGGSLHGVSEAGKVSFLDCVRGGVMSTTSWGDFAIFHSEVSFRYALFGQQHVAADENCIRGIEFTMEGVEASVFMHDKYERFGHMLNPDEEILDAIARKRPEYLKGDFVKGKAMVSYFTGNWNVLPRFDTALGTVHVGRRMQGDFFGHNMKHTPRITVDFDDEPTTLEDAWEKMRQIRQFFAWMMGYTPGWKDVRIFTTRFDKDGFRTDADGNPDGGLEVFAPNEWEKVPKGAKEVGTLIDASRHPDHFIEVMTRWLERNRDSKRKSANARFASGFRGTSSRAIEDGIISAANTFDLLPNEDKPQAEELPRDIAEVLEAAGGKIKRRMAVGSQREDVLNALGRVRKSKPLRSVVEYRAEIVLKHFGRHRLKRFEDVIRLAVRCRNHYTHGPNDRSAGDVDYSDFATVLFLTKTLEFIYGASELLMCGWDPARSQADEWHPLGGYVKCYDTNRSRALGLK